MIDGENTRTEKKWNERREGWVTNEEKGKLNETDPGQTFHPIRVAISYNSRIRLDNTPFPPFSIASFMSYHRGIG